MGIEKAWSNPDSGVHRAIALWAERCVRRVLPLFDEALPQDHRPGAALEVLLSWERGEIPMTTCRSAAFASHAAAREAMSLNLPQVVAVARAAGQAAAVAHMFNHAPHAASYASKAAMLSGGEAAAEQERVWQWINLEPGLREVVYPEGQPLLRHTRG